VYSSTTGEGPLTPLNTEFKRGTRHYTLRDDRNPNRAIELSENDLLEPTFKIGAHVQRKVDGLWGNAIFIVVSREFSVHDDSFRYCLHPQGQGPQVTAWSFQKDLRKPLI